MTSEYRDDYPTCLRTYASFRILSEHMTAGEMAELLGIQPSRSQTKLNDGRHKPRLHGWFLSSEKVVASRDLRRHLDWLLDQLLPVSGVLHPLIESGDVSADVVCYWVSASGHGGPTLSVVQLEKMCKLGVGCWFDVYFDADASAD